MTKSPFEVAESTITRLQFLIDCMAPRGSIGPLGFAEECEVVIKGVKFCIDILPSIKDLDVALSYMHGAKETYAEYYNGKRLGDLHSKDIVDCYKDMCHLQLSIARAHVVRVMNNKQLGE